MGVAFCAPSASSRFLSLSSLSISALMLRTGGEEMCSVLCASRRVRISCRRLSMSRDMVSVLRSGEWGISAPRVDLKGRMRGAWAPRVDVNGRWYGIGALRVDA